MKQYELIQHAVSLGLPTRFRNKDGKIVRLSEKALRVACLEQNERGQVTMTRYMVNRAAPALDLLTMKNIDLTRYAAALGFLTRREGGQKGYKSALRVACLEQKERGHVTMARYMDNRAASTPAFFTMKKMELMRYAKSLGVTTRRKSGPSGYMRAWRRVEDVRRDCLETEIAFVNGVIHNRSDLAGVNDRHRFL